MIRFTCNCGTTIEVGDAQAGLKAQCPGCKTMVVAPPLGDELVLEPIPLADESAPPIVPPPTQVQATGIPTAQAAPRRVFRYARSAASGPQTAQGRHQRAWAIQVEGTSLVSLLIACVLAVVADLAAGLFFGPFAFAVAGLVGMVTLSHLANIAEEIGPEDRDELPRIGRDMDIFEDVWRPFLRMVLVLLLVFGPFTAVVFSTPSLHTPGGVFRSLAAVAWAMVAWPVILLTVATSGSTRNLWPPRVVTAAVAGGGDYLRCLLTSVPLVILSLLLWSETVQMMAAHRLRPVSAVADYMAIRVFLIGAWVILAQVLSTQVGLLWRFHHTKFGWVNQQYIAPPRAQYTPGQRPPV